MRNSLVTKSKIDKLQKRLDLLYKKNINIGLTELELEKYKEMQVEFYILHDQYIDSEFERVFLTHLYSQEVIISLEIIKSLIPWEGGHILTIKEFENIMESSSQINESDLQLLDINLRRVHVNIFNNLEKLCMQSDLDDFILSTAEFVMNKKGAGLDDLVEYTDSIYRELAELFNIELDEVLIYWE